MVTVFPDATTLITALYVIILYICLSRLFFGPINQILKKRHELIEGRQENARRRIEVVEQRTSEYEHALRAAKTEAYQRQEQERERALAEKAALVAEAKKQTDKTIEEARTSLTAQGKVISRKLEAEVDALAKQLTTSILRD
jgi:F0F1-type ATP synthase membrane subunit b/b'